MSKTPYEIELFVEEVSDSPLFHGAVWHVYATDHSRIQMIEALSAHFHTKEQATTYIEAIKCNLKHKVKSVWYHDSYQKRLSEKPKTQTLTGPILGREDALQTVRWP